MAGPSLGPGSSCRWSADNWHEVPRSVYSHLLAEWPLPHRHTSPNHRLSWTWRPPATWITISFSQVTKVMYLIPLASMQLINISPHREITMNWDQKDILNKGGVFGVLYWDFFFGQINSGHVNGYKPIVKLVFVFC